MSNPETMLNQLAAFVRHASYEELSEQARLHLKIRVLDALACAIGALDGLPIHMIRQQLDDFGGAPRCSLIGGGRTAPDRAAFYNSALVRYLDFNDSYLAKGESCHPSDSLGPVLAASEYVGATGKELMTALAVAYQVQCRLSDKAPVRDRGFDHTTQGSYAMAAGISKALGLDQTKTANAIAISGTAFNALRVTRTGKLSHWKGLASPNTAFSSTHAAFLAMRGISGPPEVFEGNKGFMDTIAGEFYIDWQSEDLERVTLTILKEYNAEIHSQSAIEGILELREEYGVRGDDVELIELETFQVAYDIIGGGEEGSKRSVHTKEEADHSLPYILAVALLDGQVGPSQYTDERIQSADVQALLKRVFIRPSAAYSERFPDEMPCHLRVVLKDGRQLEKEKRDYEGFITRPMSWETISRKFSWLSRPFTRPALQQQIITAVAELESVPVADLMGLLTQIQKPQ